MIYFYVLEQNILYKKKYNTRVKHNYLHVWQVARYEVIRTKQRRFYVPPIHYIIRAEKLKCAEGVPQDITRALHVYSLNKSKLYNARKR